MLAVDYEKINHWLEIYDLNSHKGVTQEEADLIFQAKHVLRLDGVFAILKPDVMNRIETIVTKVRN